MVRILGGLVLSFALAAATVGAAQTRPIFTGLWKFEADRSTPPRGQGAFGKEFRITQEANALVLEVPVTQFKDTDDGKTVSVDAGLSAPFVYKLDGNEHVAPPLSPLVRLPDGSSGIHSVLGGPYRASLDGNAVVITASGEIPYTSFRNGWVMEMVRRQISTRFSMNPDGTLLVERAMERDPADKGQIEGAKAAFKSLYRKTS